MHHTPFDWVCFRLLSSPQQHSMIFLLGKFSISYMNMSIVPCTIIHVEKLWWKTLYGECWHCHLAFFIIIFFYSLSCLTLVSLTLCMVTPHHAMPCHATPHVRLLVICVLSSHNGMVCAIQKTLFYTQRETCTCARAQNTCRNNRFLYSLSAHSERKTLTYTDQTYHFYTLLAKDEIITRIVERWANAKCSKETKSSARTHTKRKLENK